MNELKWINKPYVPAIYECPECKKLITFASTGNLKYAREVFGYNKCSGGYTKGPGLFGIDNKPHSCKITRDYKKQEVTLND